MNGQYGPEAVLNSRGLLLQSQFVYIFDVGTSTLASTFIAEDSTDPGPNPAITSPTGNLVFYADPGEYDLSLTNPPTDALTVVVEPDSGGFDGSTIDFTANLPVNQNLFPFDSNSGFEDGAGTDNWFTSSNQTIAASTDYFMLADGHHSLKITHASGSLSGTLYMGQNGTAPFTPSSPPTGFITVSEGESIDLYCWVRAPVGGPTANFQIKPNWYDSTGTFISGSVWSPTSDSNTDWVPIKTTFTVPTNAHWMQFTLACAFIGAGEIHYVDRVIAHRPALDSQDVAWEVSEYRGGQPNVSAPGHSLSRFPSISGQYGPFVVSSDFTSVDVVEDGIYSVLLVIYSDIFDPAIDKNQAAIGLTLTRYSPFSPFLGFTSRSLYAVVRSDRPYPYADVFGDTADAYYQGSFAATLPIWAPETIKVRSFCTNLDYPPVAWGEFTICRIGGLGSWTQDPN